MKINQFEDILSWQKGRELTKSIYKLTKSKDFRKDLSLCNQVQKASVSVMANIAEGFDRQTRKEFTQFLKYASASASEVQSHLYVALDQGYISEREFYDAYAKAKETKMLINGFISYLKGNKRKK